MQQYLSWGREQDYSARYSGALVADFHRNLLKSGLYLYPNTAQLPSGKIRLLYEAFPITFLAEQASGRAIENDQSIPNVRAVDLHQRRPLYAGSANRVDQVMNMQTILRHFLSN